MSGVAEKLQAELDRSMTERERQSLSAFYSDQNAKLEENANQFADAGSQQMITTFLLCFSGRVAVGFNVGGGTCVDLRGNRYSFRLEGFGLSFGATLSGQGLIHRGLGDLRGHYRGLSGGAVNTLMAWGQKISKTVFPLVGPDLQMLQNTLHHDSTLIMVGVSAGLSIDVSGVGMTIQ